MRMKAYLSLYVIFSINICSALLCSQDYCTSPKPGGGKDCWAGSPGELCTCSQGTVLLFGMKNYPSQISLFYVPGAAKLTNRTQSVNGVTVWEYTCCFGSGPQIVNTTCALGACSSSACTSKDDSNAAGGSGTDCYAGAIVQPCTCSGNLQAVLTGPTKYFDGIKYYQYTCCPANTPGVVGDDCADFSIYNVVTKVVVPVVVFLCVMICACVGFCVYMQIGFFKKPGQKGYTPNPQNAA